MKRWNDVKIFSNYNSRRQSRPLNGNEQKWMRFLIAGEVCRKLRIRFRIGCCFVFSSKMYFWLAFSGKNARELLRISCDTFFLHQLSNFQEMIPRVKKQYGGIDKKKNREIFARTAFLSSKFSVYFTGTSKSKAFGKTRQMKVR